MPITDTDIVITETSTRTDEGEGALAERIDAAAKAMAAIHHGAGAGKAEDGSGKEPVREWRFSISIEKDSKGALKPTVKVRGDDEAQVLDAIERIYVRLRMIFGEMIL